MHLRMRTICRKAYDLWFIGGEGERVNMFHAAEIIPAYSFSPSRMLETGPNNMESQSSLRYFARPVAL